MTTIRMIDPPTGWLYGFPKEYNPKEGQTCADWLIENGYPKGMASWAAEHCRSWNDDVKDEDPERIDVV